jgi:ankyrin repeat protein
LATDPAEARREGGPHRWEPLLYLAYSRVNSTAAGCSTLEVARLLLTAGADPNAGYLWEAEYPFTALTGAFGEGESGPYRTPPHQHELPLARLLLEAGADPNDSQTLYNRQWSRDDRHLELLLEFGLGRGTGPTVWHGRLGLDHPTPQELVEEELRKAAASGRIARVRLLLPHVEDLDGIGCDHPLLEGRTAHQLARLNGHGEIAELLARAGAGPVRLTPAEELREAVLRADRVRVDELVGRDPGVLAQLVDRYPDLAGTAAELNRVDSVRLLAGLGFDLNPTDRRTPLHEAAFHGHIDIVEALIALGADPTIRDPDHDSTPLGWAAHAHQEHVVAFLAPLTS